LLSFLEKAEGVILSSQPLRNGKGSDPG
jgi:hypothetical protein